MALVTTLLSGLSSSNIAISDLANGTDGELITWDATGAPAAVAVGTATHVLTSNGTGAAPTFQVVSASGTGMVVQVVTASTNTSVTTTTQIPCDDTVPQNTEGAEAMTLAITPTSATNRLVIIFNAVMGSGGDIVSVALFQDATAGALAAIGELASATTSPISMTLMHTMISGTASETTFKIRFGPNSATSTRFLGASAGDRYGAAGLGTIAIYEIKV